jgi:hypothetical protein
MHPDKLIVETSFHVFVPQGEGRPERRVEYRAGMLVEADDIPEGQTADDWVAKGLAKAA